MIMPSYGWENGRLWQLWPLIHLGSKLSKKPFWSLNTKCQIKS
uniref:Uncharacterized protein n=1 Tax=Arundo donax TaxID=35708 RepID=A0A0A8YEP8_ARUDO